MRGTKSARSTGRQGRYELDIVACREGVLHFVEVKTRRSGSLTPPRQPVTQRKFRALSRAAACYLRTVGWEGEVAVRSGRPPKPPPTAASASN